MKKAFYYNRIAYKLGYSFELSDMYMKGIGCEQNYDEAFKVLLSQGNIFSNIYNFKEPFINQNTRALYNWYCCLTNKRLILDNHVCRKMLMAFDDKVIKDNIKRHVRRKIFFCLKIFVMIRSWYYSTL